MVSIIVCVYNCEAYIGECIESILNQTYSNIELVIINDGSTDNTKEICSGYAEKDSRVHLINQSNKGIGTSRNNGIIQAKGEYLFFCDADDFLAPHAIERLYELSDEYNSDMVICSDIDIVEGKQVSNSYSQKSGIIDEKLYFELMYNGDRNMFRSLVSVIRTLFKKSIFEYEDCKFADGRIYEDNYVIHHLVDKAKNIYWTEEPLYYYRILSDSISHCEFKMSRIDDFYAQLDRLNFLEAKYKNELFYKNMIKQCLDDGYHFYERALFLKMAHKNELTEYRKDVNNAIRKYGKMYHGTRRIMWYFFLWCPHAFDFLERVKHR